MNHRFPHERLDCYPLAVDFAQWAYGLRVPADRKHLRDQLTRAADSAVLNIAEGCGRGPGAACRNHHRIAHGSAAECSAVLDLLAPPEREARQVQLRRIGAMLHGLARK